VKRPDGFSLRLDGCGSFGQTVTRPDAGGSNSQTTRLHVRTRATCPYIFEATHVRTGLMSLPDKDPTASIKPGRRIFSLPHSISHSLLAVCECLLMRFCFFLPSLSCCALLTTFQVFFWLTLFLSVSFKTVRIVIFWNVIEFL
jgi:hypothetical protein